MNLNDFPSPPPSSPHPLALDLGTKAEHPMTIQAQRIAQGHSRQPETTFPSRPLATSTLRQQRSYDQIGVRNATSYTQGGLRTQRSYDHQRPEYPPSPISTSHTLQPGVANSLDHSSLLQINDITQAVSGHLSTSDLIHGKSTSELVASDEELSKAAARFQVPFFAPPVSVHHDQLPASIRWIRPTHPPLDVTNEKFTITVKKNSILRTGMPHPYVGVRLLSLVDIGVVPPGILVEEGMKVDYLMHTFFAQYRIHRVRRVRNHLVDVEIVAWDNEDPLKYYDLSSRYWPPVVITLPSSIVSSSLMSTVIEESLGPITRDEESGSVTTVPGALSATANTRYGRGERLWKFVMHLFQK